MRRTVASASTATGTPGLSTSLPTNADVSIVTVSGDVRSVDGASSPAACSGSPDGTWTVATSDCSQKSRPTLSNVAARHRRLSGAPAGSRARNATSSAAGSVIIAANPLGSIDLAAGSPDPLPTRVDVATMATRTMAAGAHQRPSASHERGRRPARPPRR